jgi:hypothetical protein
VQGESSSFNPATSVNTCSHPKEVEFLPAFAKAGLLCGGLLCWLAIVSYVLDVSGQGLCPPALLRRDRPEGQRSKWGGILLLSDYWLVCLAKPTDLLRVDT